MDYRIRVRGHLDPAWSARLSGARIAHEEAGTCLLSGWLPDQAALHGILLQLIRLGLPLLALDTDDPAAGGQARGNDDRAPPPQHGERKGDANRGIPGTHYSTGRTQMSKVITQMSISLDGFVGGASEASWWPTHERLLGWVFGLASWRAMQGMEGGEENGASALLAEDIDRTGAYILGRNMFDFGEEPWGDVPPYRAPVFILTHRERETVTKGGGTSYTFVTDGVESAVAQAKAAAGGKDVMISGGAGVIRAVLGAGLLDEIHLHVAPVLLGQGVRLFEGLGGGPIELERLRAVESPAMTHLQFRVVK